MPENQSQTSNEDAQHPKDGPQAARQGDEGGEVTRPSDTEAAHAPQEGKAFSGDENQGASGVAGQKDRREDYGGGNMGHSAPGTDRMTAGAEFADRLPEAAATPAVDGETGKKSPTS